MIDTDGFRPNVGIIIFNEQGRVLWAKRVGQEAWQFPQGGVQRKESADDAMLRELNEEVGLDPQDVEIIASTRGWLRYRLPGHLVRQHSSPVCIGQKQKWYLLRLLAGSERITLDSGGRPEFDDWRWVSYWYPLNQVIAFKRNVYKKALEELIVPLNRALQVKA
ncbi:MAG: RNA pyrophosphohydrolase [Pseudomonadales bacterium]|nr:RNA pyrophosphohydrolase [Pseudomonadales bacterium]